MSFLAQENVPRCTFAQQSISFSVKYNRRSNSSHLNPWTQHPACHPPAKEAASLAPFHALFRPAYPSRISVALCNIFFAILYPQRFPIRNLLDPSEPSPTEFNSSRQARTSPSLSLLRAKPTLPSMSIFLQKIKHS